MTARIEIAMDNAAFDESSGAELARILRGVAAKLGHVVEEGGWNLHDTNGNTVGEVTFTDD